MSESINLDLSEIPGLGPVRRTALEAAGIRDIQALVALSVAELAAIRGIGVWQARKIREFLRQRELLAPGDDEDGSGAILVVEAAPDRSLAGLSETWQEVEAEAATIAAGVAGAVAAGVIGEMIEEAEETQARAVLREEAAIVSGAGSSSRAEGGTGEAPEEPGDSSDGAVGDGERRDDQEEPEDDEEGDGADWQSRVAEQREQLPETALTLMEAIRQAAVTPQLTRQVTRLLITASEFVGDSRKLSEDAQEKAASVLEAAERTLQRAVEKRTFSQRDQRDLARKIRRRRKELEQLLEEE